eukprot:7236334-Pyramimonas_sp.AAC.1
MLASQSANSKRPHARTLLSDCRQANAPTGMQFLRASWIFYGGLIVVSVVGGNVFLERSVLSELLPPWERLDLAVLCIAPLGASLFLFLKYADDVPAIVRVQHPRLPQYNACNFLIQFLTSANLAGHVWYESIA